MIKIPNNTLNFHLSLTLTARFGLSLLHRRGDDRLDGEEIGVSVINGPSDLNFRLRGVELASEGVFSGAMGIVSEGDCVASLRLRPAMLGI